FAGGVTRTLRKDGSVVHFSPSVERGLYPPEQTADPLNPPLMASYGSTAVTADGNGNLVLDTLDGGGQVVRAVDQAGRLPSVQRTDDNQVSAETDTRGNTTHYT